MGCVQYPAGRCSPARVIFPWGGQLGCSPRAAAMVGAHPESSFTRSGPTFSDVPPRGRARRGAVRPQPPPCLPFARPGGPVDVVGGGLFLISFAGVLDRNPPESFFIGLFCEHRFCGLFFLSFRVFW